MLNDKNTSKPNDSSWRIASVWNQALTKTPIKQGREKVIKDYFDLYVKSGIMDFFAKEIRKEFGIPSLHPDDLQLIVYPINEDDLVEEEKSGFKIVDVISEYGSGISNKRPIFWQMLHRLEKKEAQGILCTSWDRLTRNVITHFLLKDDFERNGIEVISLSVVDNDPILDRIFHSHAINW